jgi:hypothetical protein
VGRVPGACRVAVSVPSDWIEHRRGDGELLGWIRPEADGFVGIDLLQRPLTGVVDWLAAEETLESTGIGYLADRYEYLDAKGEWLPVLIVEVSDDLVRLKKGYWAAIDAPFTEHLLVFPVEGRLRPLAPA